MSNIWINNNLPDLEQNNSQNSKNIFRTNNFSKYILAVSLSISSIIMSEKSNAEEEIQDLSQNETSQRINDSREIINVLSDFFTEQNIELDKTKLDDLYDQYFEWKIWPNTKLYLKNILLEGYLWMLEEWYSVVWYQELDELVEKIDELSNWEISINFWDSMPQDSEFNEKITIVWEISNNNLRIQESWWNLFSNKNETQININNKNLVNVFVSDIPNSFNNSLNRIIEINNKYIELRQQLRNSKQTIDSLEFDIRELNETLSKNEQDYNQEIQRLEEEKNQNISQLEQSLDNEIAELTEKHAQEISDFEERIYTKNSEIEELRNNHNREIENLRATNLREKSRVEDEANQRIVNLQNAFNLDRNEYIEEIEELEEEIENNRRVNQTQTQTLSAQIEELTNSNEELSDENSNLRNNISELNKSLEIIREKEASITEELSRKEIEVDTLIEEKNQLVSQINTVGDARWELLNQTQESLRDSESLNQRLNNRIAQLDIEVANLISQISWLEQEKSELLEFEEKAQKLDSAMERLERMRIEVETLTDENNSLEEQNEDLEEENQELEELRDYVDRYNQLSPSLDQANQTVEQLEEQTTRQQNQIEVLETQNNWLQQSLRSQQQNNQTLLNQISSLQESYDDLLKWNIDISEESITQELREQNQVNSRLTQENQELREQAEQANMQRDQAQRELIQAQADFAEKEVEMRREFERKYAEFVRDSILWE